MQPLSKLEWHIRFSGSLASPDYKNINFLGLTPRELLDHGPPILSPEMPEFYYYENGFPYNSRFWNGKDKMEPCAGTQIARSTTFIIYIFHFKQLFTNKNL